MYVYMYIYVRVHVYIYMYVYMCIYICTCTCVYIYVRVHVYIYIFTISVTGECFKHVYMATLLFHTKIKKKRSNLPEKKLSYRLETLAYRHNWTL